MTNPTGLHVIIEGRVQGVGFRYFVLEEAQKLQITGWVRNLERGAVEVLAEGDRGTLGQFLSQLERGPRSAFVSQVNITWEEATHQFIKFSIAPTDW